MTNDILDTKEYELGFLLKDEQGITAILALLNKLSCNVSFQSDIRRMTLAYPIKKETGALFGFILFSGMPDVIHELNHELQLESGVLRFIIIANPPARDTHPLTDYTTRRVSEKKQGEEQPAADTVTNEDLEKKLEEILM